MTVYTAQGTTIALETAASPQTFTTIPQVTDISAVGQDRGLIDVSNLSSAAREYKKALEDGQEIVLTAQYDPDDTTHIALRTAFKAETTSNFRVTYTDSPAQTVTFAAQVTNYSVTNLNVDNVLTLNCTLKPSGDLTYA